MKLYEYLCYVLKLASITSVVLVQEPFLTLAHTKR